MFHKMIKRLCALCCLAMLALPAVAGAAGAEKAVTVGSGAGSAAVAGKDSVADTKAAYPDVKPDGENPALQIFSNTANGFSMAFPAEMAAQPLGQNPVAVLRAVDRKTDAGVTVDIARLDLRGPLMPFQVEEFRKELLFNAKQVAKNSGKKVLTMKRETVAGQDTVHIATSAKAADGSRTIVRDKYVFVTENRMYAVTYIMPESQYKKYGPEIPGFMETVEIYPLWTTAEIKGMGYSCQLPASCINLGDAPNTAVYGNEAAMVGMVLESAADEKWRFLPRFPVAEGSRDAVLEDLKAKVMRDTRDEAEDFHGVFTEVQGRECIRNIYRLKGDYNESYIFRDGDDVMELGFLYHPENEEKARLIIKKALATLTFPDK